MSDLIIVVDSREQKPYQFPCETVVKGLKAGDYSVLGLEDRVAVERKSLSDAYGTFGGGGDRFERELEKLAKMDFAMVIIEASMKKALTRPPKRSKFPPKSFNRRMIAWMQRHNVHFWFADNRELAQRQTFIILERFWRDVRDGKR